MRTTVLAAAVACAAGIRLQTPTDVAAIQRCSLLVSGGSPTLIQDLPEGCRTAVITTALDLQSDVTGIIYAIGEQRLEIIAEGQRAALDRIASFVEEKVNAEHGSSLRIVSAHSRRKPQPRSNSTLLPACRAGSHPPTRTIPSSP